MTDRQDFLPGDVVQYTGPDCMGLLHLGRYQVHEVSPDGWPIFWSLPDAAWRPGLFKLIERPER